MTEAAQVSFETELGVELQPTGGIASMQPAAMALDSIRLAVHRELSAVEHVWRAFETHADCTAFQTYGWLAAWQAHIGIRHGVRPVIVIGTGADGSILFLLPLALQRIGPATELTWLGSELCDYNAPLLAADFPARVPVAAFALLWDRIQRAIRAEPDLHYDLVRLVKMPDQVRALANPLCQLRVSKTPSSAYLAPLPGDWPAFYNSKRSSATRRRDRSKRRHLAELGTVEFVTATTMADIADTFDTLMQQKAQTLAKMGVADFFAQPGYAEFYRALATGAATRDFVHVSRLEVGGKIAAANFGLTFAGCYYHLLASYDNGEVSRFGPGMAHLHELLCYAIERKFRFFDFTIGDERYKRDWCDTEIPLYDHISAASWRGILLAAALRTARHVKRSIKQTPALWTAFSWTRMRLGPVTVGRDCLKPDAGR